MLNQMIEVLNKNAPKKRIIKCCHCGSMLRFSWLDEEVNFTQDGYEGQTTDWSIKCPICNRRVPTRSLTDNGYYSWGYKDCEETWKYNAKIKVGDMVEYTNVDMHGVVIDDISDEEVYIFTDNGCIEKWDRKYLVKTGKSIDIETFRKLVETN